MSREQFLYEMSQKCTELIEQKKLNPEDAKLYEQAWIEASNFILKKEFKITK
jgi:hypothetical protein